jgi:hypothetical protein
MMTMRDNERGWGEMTEGWIKTTFKRKQWRGKGNEGDRGRYRPMVAVWQTSRWAVSVNHYLGASSAFYPLYESNYTIFNQPFHFKVTFNHPDCTRQQHHNDINQTGTGAERMIIKSSLEKWSSLGESVGLVGH